MAIPKKLKEISNQIAIEPQLVLLIDGINKKFTSILLEKNLRFDEGYLFDEGYRFDTPINDDDSIDCVSIEETTSRISQQINIDRGGKNSVQRMSFKLIDVDGEIQKYFCNDNLVQDVLGRKAEVYLSLKGALFPEDSIRIIKGFVDDVSFGIGYTIISVSQAIKYLEQKIFSPFTCYLTASVNNTQTTIFLDDTSQILLSQDAFISHVQINDEIMEVVSKTTNSITVVRGRYQTIATTHDIDDEVKTCFELSGNAIQLALKLQLSKSNGEEFFLQAKFVSIDTFVNINNAIGFDFDVSRIGFMDGDFVEVIGTTSNDGIYEVLDIISQDATSYILVNQNLVAEITNCTIKFKSKYDLLPIGAGLTIDDVDVKSFEDIENFFGTNFFEYKFFIKDELKLKDFLEEELYYPQGLYSIVRNGRSSIKYTAPSLVSSDSIVIDDSNVIDPQRIRVKRSLNEFFYNAIFFKYGKDFVTDKFLVTEIVVDSNSLARFKIGNKQLSVESSGIERGQANRSIILFQASRFLNRYKFAPRLISGIKILFSDAFKIEIGDVVILDGEKLKIVDVNSSQGAYLEKTYFEVINRQIDFFRGDAKLDLLETNFLIDSRFGVFSQSSFVKSQNGYEVELEFSFLGSDEFDFETDKWEEFVGNKIRIYTEDYLFDVEVTLVAIHQNKLNTILIDTNTITIPSGALVELADYNDVNSIAKNRFTFISKTTSWIAETINSFAVPTNEELYVEQKIELTTLQYNFFIETEITSISYRPIPDDYLVQVSFPDISPYLVHSNYILNTLKFSDDQENVYRYY